MSEPVRVAIVREGVVDHIEIVGPGFVAPDGTRAIPSQTANIGDHFDGVDFTPAPRPTDPEDVQKRVWVFHEGMVRQKFSIDVGDNTVVVTDLRAPTRDNIMMLQFWGQSHPTATRVWHDDLGNRTPLTGAQFVKLAQAVTTAILDVYENVDAIVTDIHSPKRTIWTDEDVQAALRRGLPPVVE